MNKQDVLSTMVAKHISTLVTIYAKILDQDLTAPQFYILQTLIEDGPLPSSYFVQALSVTAPAVTNLSNKLVNKGYIERMPSPDDRRQVLLQITEQGEMVHATMLSKYKELTGDLWNDFSEEEMNTLIVAYQKMISSWQEIGQQKMTKTTEEQ
ncbi:MarR family transcriptional regulator [Paenibacillus sp. Marseille-Q4541]|uniref:MarR family transcriptional regulator n=1 Tax=Paenibacillus sp. Marseille-Q4541 TaxID=2831522 RepID=UPI0020186D25|nr:MarR family transcriptional regulator [Paenibacillus sp. Marseille-Q4541]